MSDDHAITGELGVVEGYKTLTGAKQTSLDRRPFRLSRQLVKIHLTDPAELFTVRVVRRAANDMCHLVSADHVKHPLRARKSGPGVRRRYTEVPGVLRCKPKPDHKFPRLTIALPTRRSGTHSADVGPASRQSLPLVHQAPDPGRALTGRWLRTEPATTALAGR